MLQNMAVTEACVAAISSRLAGCFERCLRDLLELLELLGERYVDEKLVFWEEMVLLVRMLSLRMGLVSLRVFWLSVVLSFDMNVAMEIQRLSMDSIQSDAIECDRW
jgi:hypothetical protein